jgi:hypothetical protein
MEDEGLLGQTPIMPAQADEPAPPLSPPPPSTALVPFVGPPISNDIPAQAGKDFGILISSALLPKIKASTGSPDETTSYDSVLMELRVLTITSNSMERVAEQYPQLLPMLSWMLINRSQELAANVDEAPLAELTDEQWALIGNSLATFLASGSSKTGRPEMAVDEWIKKYPAMGELDSTQAWFRPLVNEIAKKILVDANWLARYRLFFGAGLSAIDMVSDFNVVLMYWSTPEHVDDGNTLLTCLLLNVLCQLLVVCVQNWKAPLRVLLWEIFYVLTCTKVGVDAYRVAAGVEKEAYNLYDPSFDLCEFCLSLNILRALTNNIFISLTNLHLQARPEVAS